MCAILFEYIYIYIYITVNTTIMFCSISIYLKQIAAGWLLRNRNKKYPLVSEQFKKIHGWISKCDNVIHSPIISDTIIVYDELTDKKTKRVGNLLFQCSVRELHNDLTKHIDEG